MDQDKRNTLRLLSGLAVAPFLLGSQTGKVFAQEEDAGVRDLLKYGNSNYIGFVPTQETRVDLSINRGLRTLVNYVNDNTSLELDTSIASIDLDNDDLGFFPFIYWPITQRDSTLADKPDLQRKVQEHLDRGNVIMFDVLDFDGPMLDILQDYLGDVNLGPLSPLEEDHTLTHTFFNVAGLPGSYGSEPVYIQTPNPNRSEDITSVIIGRRDWTRAVSGFAHDTQSDAFRQVWHGMVNAVIYAYMGDYKGDQFQVQQTLDNL